MQADDALCAKDFGLANGIIIGACWRGLTFGQSEGTSHPPPSQLLLVNLSIYARCWCHTGAAPFLSPCPIFFPIRQLCSSSTFWNSPTRLHANFPLLFGHSAQKRTCVNSEALQDFFPSLHLTVCGHKLIRVKMSVEIAYSLTYLFWRHFWNNAGFFV